MQRYASRTTFRRSCSGTAPSMTHDPARRGGRHDCPGSGATDISKCANWFVDAIRGVLPAFAIFGLYRLWLAIIQVWHRSFYLSKQELKSLCVHEGTEPALEELKITRDWWWVNVLFGILYVIVPALIVWFLKGG